MRAILQTFRDRRENEEGFTLIELMVVVLIIAILIAIAIPTFLGARDRANDRASQSDLRNGLVAAKVIFTDNSDYTAATSGALVGVEPSLTFGGTSTTDPGALSVATNDATVTMASLSATGTCFWIRDITQGTSAGTTYASGTVTTCNVASATAFGASW